MNDNNTQWASYDSAADVFGSVSVPLLFQRPAEDLIHLLKPGRNQKLLDVGAGTGAISKAAKESQLGFLTALDVSAEMLKRASLRNVVAGRVPGLPFIANTFHFITAGFVLNHVKDYKNALIDMIRVLVPSGKVGLTFWKVNQSHYTEEWSQIAQSFAGKTFFDNVAKQVLPCEDWFTESDHIRRALSEAGFYSISIEERTYRCATTIDDFLASRHISLQARFLRQTLDDLSWLRFLETVQETFRTRFKEPLEFSNVVLFGIAQKADG